MTALRRVGMCGSDKRMDQRGNFDLPVNPLPVKCQRCTFPDLDFVPQPYFLAKGISTPTEMQQAELGNFFVRERTRKVLEAVVPDQCRFYPTHDLKTKAPTPWFLTVPTTLVLTATVRQSVPRCPDCGEPKVAHPGSHYEYLDWGPVSQDVFKSLNWSSSERTGEESRWYQMNVLGLKNVPRGSGPDGGYLKGKEGPPWTRVDVDRNLYFSTRLETLLKTLGIRGLLRLGCYDEKSNAQDRAWVSEKMELLAGQGLSEKPGAKLSPGLDKWFRGYLKKNAAKQQATFDFAVLEREHGVELPPAYKEFFSVV